MMEYRETFLLLLKHFDETRQSRYSDSKLGFKYHVDEVFFYFVSLFSNCVVQFLCMLSG